MFSVGIDAHDRSYAMCILDDHGKVFKQHTLSGSVPEVAAWDLVAPALCGLILLRSGLHPIAVHGWKPSGKTLISTGWASGSHLMCDARQDVRM